MASPTLDFHHLSLRLRCIDGSFMGVLWGFGGFGSIWGVGGVRGVRGVWGVWEHLGGWGG